MDTRTSHLNPGTWSATILSIGSSPEPQLLPLATDSGLAVADASQWMFRHRMSNVSTQVAPPLRATLFLRGGHDWQNRVNIDMGGQDHSAFELSFLDNAGTRGDFAGTVPVITFAGNSSSTLPLFLTLKRYGRFEMGLK